MIREGRLDLRVGVTCEACGHAYEYHLYLAATGGGMSDPADEIRRRLAEGDYGYIVCPECRYLQSWMSGPWRRKMKFRSAVLGATLFVVLRHYLFGSTMGPVEEVGSRVPLVVVGYALAFLVGGVVGWTVGGRLLVPNRRRSAKDGAAPPAPKPPSVEVVR